MLHRLVRVTEDPGGAEVVAVLGESEDFDALCARRDELNEASLLGGKLLSEVRHGVRPSPQGEGDRGGQLPF